MSGQRKSKRFRGIGFRRKSRDREAIIAYHHEVSRETGIAKLGRSTLGIASVALGAVPGAIAGDVGLSVGGICTRICSRRGRQLRH